jgi:predicted DNA-binding transcriptional regulator AlpA
MRPLAEILTELDDVIQRARSHDLPLLMAALSTRTTTVSTRILAADGTPDPAEDRNLTVQEAAARLGMSAGWVYRNKDKLPFRVQIGARVLFSAAGLESWIKRRQGK